MGKDINWYIGCSGFYYREWKNFFYPAGLPQKRWFEYYCRHFNTLELNSSFYQFPKLASLQKWYHESPEHFLFSLKVPRLITHYKKFTGTEKLLEDFYGIVKEGLADKLGCILFQLPPQTVYSPEMLETIISSINPSFRTTIEFRHQSWWRQDVYGKLAKVYIIFCNVSHPKLADDLVINLPQVYFRFHGAPVMFKSAYPNEFLQNIADGIIQYKKVKDAFIYFNNTWGSAAISNAQWFQQYLGKTPAPVNVV